MRIPLARDGYKFVVPSALFAVVLLALGLSLPMMGSMFLWPGLLTLALAVFFVFFFRDPERATPRIENAIFSAGDGKVDDIEEVAMDDFPGGRALKVGVFLSVFNCHITRSSARGKVRRIHYQPGRFYNAMRRDSSLKNESNSVYLETDYGPLIVKQITGAIARRIVCTARIGQQLNAGERIGLIRMGSRIEHYMPTDVSLRVKLGARVKAGISVIAITKGGAE